MGMSDSIILYYMPPLTYILWLSTTILGKLQLSTLRGSRIRRYMDDLTTRCPVDKSAIYLISGRLSYVIAVTKHILLTLIARLYLLKSIFCRKVTVAD
ncbi:hypothetical protein F5B19DRAFT_466593 [Rostrohypoxylon terebratum]|nr:hypothetical protein F5B19DRAFT_466593 [Rostrohypoxylon terebratum]